MMAIANFLIRICMEKKPQKKLKSLFIIYMDTYIEHGI